MEQILASQRIDLRKPFGTRTPDVWKSPRVVQRRISSLPRILTIHQILGTVAREMPILK